MAVEDVIAQDQGAVRIRNKLCAEKKSLSKPIWRRLNRVREIQPPGTAIAQQLFKSRHVLGCRDNENIRYTREH